MRFEDTYLRYKDLVYNLALQYCQNREDAQEITQDVFVNLHERGDTFQGRSDLKTWVYRITVNRSLDFLKAKRRKKRGLFSSALRIESQTTELPLANFDHPGVLLESKERIADIFQAINQLPASQKTVIILLKIEQKSQAETAEIMGRSVKSIDSLYQRARKNLQKLLPPTEG